jgi:hypothetical protein
MKVLGYILFFFFAAFTSFHSEGINTYNTTGMMEIYQDTDCPHHQHTTHHCPGSCLCHRCASPIYYMDFNINLECPFCSKVHFPIYYNTYTSYNKSYIWNPPKYC